MAAAGVLAFGATEEPRPLRVILFSEWSLQVLGRGVRGCVVTSALSCLTLAGLYILLVVAFVHLSSAQFPLLLRQQHS
jgi:hypothetical protein